MHCLLTSANRACRLHGRLRVKLALQPEGGVVDWPAVMAAAQGLRLVLLTRRERREARALIIVLGGTEADALARLRPPGCQTSHRIPPGCRVRSCGPLMERKR